jgi:hypothetical protein
MLPKPIGDDALGGISAIQGKSFAALPDGITATCHLRHPLFFESETFVISAT